jgi:ferredoxin
MTSGDDRLTFTEEQLKKEAARCLGCGAAHVDTVKCFGCGVCAQMCKFDAIHLTRKSSAESIAFTDRHEAFAKYAELRRENIRIKRDAHKA